MKISVIILAAGRSQRFEEDKMLANVRGEPLILKCVKVFDKVDSIDEIVVLAQKKQIPEFQAILSAIKTPLFLVEGGEDRHHSTINGLRKASGDMVLIHDGARCFASVSLIERIIDEFDFVYGLIPTVDSTDSLINEKEDIKYIERKSVKCVQTPQAFDRIKLLNLYEELLAENADISALTDNGAVWAKKYPLKTVAGEVENKKITFKSDLKECNSNLSEIETADKVLHTGNGFDMHELAIGRKLVLCGVEIKSEKGLVGVSDADVVLHAIMDALLSSVSLPDIGHRFPPSDPQYKGADSAKLLENVLTAVKESGGNVENVSITILAEKPRLAPYIPQMKNRLSRLLQIEESNIGISATTTEGLGLVGREEGIACYATCLTRISKK